MLDDVDRRILRQWQADPGLTMSELADRAGLSAARASRRIERMQAEGVIGKPEAVIDWAALGYTVQVSLRVQIDKTEPRAFDAFTAAAREVPEVTEIQTFLGRVDLRLNVIARDMAHYREIYRERILTLPYVDDIEALMTVATIKREEALPL